MSQFGIDSFVLDNNPEPGFYVDAGCASGTFLSNTYLLDKKGWKGICIDCFPREFGDRTATVVKACLYSSNDQEVEFDYIYEEPSLSGIHKEICDTTITVWKNFTKHTFITRTLDSVLDEHKAPSRIEYLNLDIEGAEFEALRVFPFHRYFFRFISVEHNSQEPRRSMIRLLLESQGYEFIGHTEVDDVYKYTKW
jgi:FkbM family methyltransferase